MPYRVTNARAVPGSEVRGPIAHRPLSEAWPTRPPSKGATAESAPPCSRDASTESTSRTVPLVIRLAMNETCCTRSASWKLFRELSTRPRTLINQRCMRIDERLMLAIRPEPKRAPHKCGTWAQVINPPRTGHDRSGRASANHWGPWVVGLVSPTMADVREILASMTLGRRRAQSTQWPRCSSSGRRGGARRRFH